jgi:hypothetical protein
VRLSGRTPLATTSSRSQHLDNSEAVRAHATGEGVPRDGDGVLDPPRVHVRGDERGPGDGAGAGDFVEHPLGVVQEAAFRVEAEEGGEDVAIGMGGELEGAGVELHAGE